MKYTSITALERAILKRYERIAHSGKYKMDPLMRDYGVSAEDRTYKRSYKECGLCVLGALLIERKVVEGLVRLDLSRVTGLGLLDTLALSEGTMDIGNGDNKYNQLGRRLSKKARRILASIESEKKRKARAAHGR